MLYYKIDHIRLDYLKCIHFEQSMPVAAATRSSEQRFPLAVEKHRCVLCDQNLKQKVHSRHIRTFAWKCSLITQTMHTHIDRIVLCGVRFRTESNRPIDGKERKSDPHRGKKAEQMAQINARASIQWRNREPIYSSLEMLMLRCRCREA